MLPASVYRMLELTPSRWCEDGHMVPHRKGYKISQYHLCNNKKDAQVISFFNIYHVNQY